MADEDKEIISLALTRGTIKQIAIVLREASMNFHNNSRNDFIAALREVQAETGINLLNCRSGGPIDMDCYDAELCGCQITVIGM